MNLFKMQVRDVCCTTEKIDFNNLQGKKVQVCSGDSDSVRLFSVYFPIVIHAPYWPKDRCDYEDSCEVPTGR